MLVQCQFDLENSLLKQQEISLEEELERLYRENKKIDLPMTRSKKGKFKPTTIENNNRQLEGKIQQQQKQQEEQQTQQADQTQQQETQQEVAENQ